MKTEVKPAEGYGLPKTFVTPNSAIMHEYFSKHTPPTTANPKINSHIFKNLTDIL